MDWDCDLCTSVVFQALATNMTSVSHNGEDSEPPLLQDNSWVQQMDIQWDIQFEQ